MRLIISGPGRRLSSAARKRKSTCLTEKVPLREMKRKKSRDAPREPSAFIPRVFQVSGVGLIIAGAVLLRDVDDFGNFLGNETTAPPIVLIVVGVVVFAIAFFGCCGAIKESYNMLMAVLSMNLFVIRPAGSCTPSHSCGVGRGRGR